MHTHGVRTRRFKKRIRKREFNQGKPQKETKKLYYFFFLLVFLAFVFFFAIVFHTQNFSVRKISTCMNRF